MGQRVIVERDGLPTAPAWRYLDGRSVGLHPVEWAPDGGGGDQVQPDGTRWHYDPPVTGRIAGHAVRCCSPAGQLAAYLGYQPDDIDRADMVSPSRALPAHRTGAVRSRLNVYTYPSAGHRRTP